MEQTFPAEATRKVTLQQIKGAVTIHGWDEPTIQFRSEDEPDRLEIVDDTLQIYGCDSDIELAVPTRYTIAGNHLNNHVEIEAVHAVSLSQVDGDVSINTIQDNVELGSIKGTTSLTAIAGDILIDQIKRNLFIAQSGNVTITGKAHNQAVIEHAGNVTITHTGHNLSLKECGEVSIQHVGHNLEAEQIAALKCGHVGNSCQIAGNNEATILLRSVGNDLRVSGIANLKVNHIGNRLEVQDIQGNVETKHVGNNLIVTGVGGNLTAGHVGNNATVSGVQGNITISTVGSRLTLGRIPAPEQTVRARAGSDIEIILPEQTNTTLYAQAGRAIRGVNLENTYIPRNTATIVYGNGTAAVWLMAGKDIIIQSSENPLDIEEGFYQKQWNDWWENLANRFADIDDEWPTTFLDMAAAIGMSRFGYNNDKYQWKQAEQQQKAERQAQRAQAHERREQQKQSRNYYKQTRHSYKQDWPINPEQINEIIDKAQQAAMDGIQGAQEAVEQAVQNLQRHYKDITFPSFTETNFAGEKSKKADDASQATSANSGVALHPQPDREQERKAILHMIAEGRITAAEGDMLLEALDD